MFDLKNAMNFIQDDENGDFLKSLTQIKSKEDLEKFVAELPEKLKDNEQVMKLIDEKKEELSKNAPDLLNVVLKFKQ